MQSVVPEHNIYSLNKISCKFNKTFSSFRNGRRELSRIASATTASSPNGRPTAVRRLWKSRPKRRRPQNAPQRKPRPAEGPVAARAALRSRGPRRKRPSTQRRRSRAALAAISRAKSSSRIPTRKKVKVVIIDLA